MSCIFSCCSQDKALISKPSFEEFWHRDVEESIRQGSSNPFIEEASLQVSNWGFSLVDLQVQEKCSGKGILSWLKFGYGQVKCELTGFLGPVHIWQVCKHLNLVSSVSFAFSSLPAMSFVRTLICAKIGLSLLCLNSVEYIS